MKIADRQIDIYINTDKKCVPFIIFNSDGDEAIAVNKRLLEYGCHDYVLIAISGLDWNSDLSPWSSPAIFKNGEDFKGNADAYLQELINTIIPEVINHLKEKEISAECLSIAGYSLAGLFALYALYNCDLFSNAASASGSLWYPGFMEYIESHKLSDKVDKIYLSLGNAESKTRNPVMAKVEENTIRYYESLKDKIDIFYEENEGNHFRDPDIRMAKGIKYLLDQ